MQRALDDGAVDLWLADPGRLAQSPQALSRADAVLAPQERDAASRPRTAEDRSQALFARALLRLTLSRYADVAPQAWRFEAGEHGRPRLADVHDAQRAPAFNLSHTRGLLAIAVARGDLGVDVEALDRGVPASIARRFFAPLERRQLDALAPERRARRLLELWTLKESYAKALGLGLRLPFDSFAFDLSEPGRIALQPAAHDPGPWCVQSLELASGALCALCTRGRAPAPTPTCLLVDATLDATIAPAHIVRAGCH